MSAAKKAGVGHIVLLSVFGAESAPGLQNARRHRESEKNLVASGLSWTFVRSGAFASNALGWAPSIQAQGEVYAPSGEGKNARTHPLDRMDRPLAGSPADRVSAARPLPRSRRDRS